MRLTLSYRVGCCDQSTFVTLKITPTRNTILNRIRFKTNKYISNCIAYTCCLLCTCCLFNIIY